MFQDLKSLYTYFTYSEPDGKYAGPIIASPLSIHFARVYLYRNWDFKKILVYEAFITYSQRYGNPFFKKQSVMIQDLRITKYSLLKTMNYLIDDGYITKSQGGESDNFKNFYTVVFDNILKNLHQIYDFDKFGDDNKQIAIEMFQYKFEMYKNMAIKHDGRFPKYH